MRAAAGPAAGRLAGELQMAGDHAIPAAQAYLRRRVQVRAMAGAEPTVRVRAPLLWATEYGAYRNHYSTYKRRGQPVTRRTRMQFSPYRRAGYWIAPTIRSAAPDIFARYVAGLTAAIQKHAGGADGTV
jgi:hypothetical protein